MSSNVQPSTINVPFINNPDGSLNLDTMATNVIDNISITSGDAAIIRTFLTNVGQQVIQNKEKCNLLLRITKKLMS